MCYSVCKVSRKVLPHEELKQNHNNGIPESTLASSSYPSLQYAWSSGKAYIAYGLILAAGTMVSSCLNILYAIFCIKIYLCLTATSLKVPLQGFWK